MPADMFVKLPSKPDSSQDDPPFSKYASMQQSSRVEQWHRVSNMLIPAGNAGRTFIANLVALRAGLWSLANYAKLGHMADHLCTLDMPTLLEIDRLQQQLGPSVGPRLYSDVPNPASMPEGNRGEEGQLYNWQAHLAASHLGCNPKQVPTTAGSLSASQKATITSATSQVANSGAANPNARPAGLKAMAVTDAAGCGWLQYSPNGQVQPTAVPPRAAWIPPKILQAMDQAMQKGTQYPAPTAPEDLGEGWSAAATEEAAGALMQLGAGPSPQTYAAAARSPAARGRAGAAAAGPTAAAGTTSGRSPAVGIAAGRSPAAATAVAVGGAARQRQAAAAVVRRSLVPVMNKVGLGKKSGGKWSRQVVAGVPRTLPNRFDPIETAAEKALFYQLLPQCTRGGGKVDFGQMTIRWGQAFMLHSEVVHMIREPSQLIGMKGPKQLKQYFQLNDRRKRARVNELMSDALVAHAAATDSVQAAGNQPTITSFFHTQQPSPSHRPTKRQHLTRPSAQPATAAAGPSSAAAGPSSAAAAQPTTAAAGPSSAAAAQPATAVAGPSSAAAGPSSAAAAQPTTAAAGPSSAAAAQPATAAAGPSSAAAAQPATARHNKVVYCNLCAFYLGNLCKKTDCTGGQGTCPARNLGYTSDQLKADCPRLGKSSAADIKGKGVTNPPRRMN